MAVKKSIHLDLEEGLDRKTLKQLVNRFMDINRGRMQRTREALPGRQQLFLDLLPLLFHVNHPLLPGYAGSDVPCGISDYTPQKDSLAAAQRLTRSFQHKRRASSRVWIHSIFLMGSTGTIAHSGSSSDMDVWVCYRPGLNRESIQLLETKAALITEWAEEIGVEAHFFVMDDNDFKAGKRSTQVTTEDCGTAQHYLLLDEFYRTALLIAGRYPLWWLVPANEEKNYEEFTHALLHKRFIRENDVVDFGGIAHIPAGEFIGAGLWQLYKGIDAPYKSVLKLLLTEAYASEHPNVESLSVGYKKAIYSSQLDLDELDPYVMVYRRLEKYLSQREELDRLELIRRCFYFKVGTKLSSAHRSQVKSWRRLLMEKLVMEWNWSDSYLQELDTRHQWRVEKVVPERKELVNELTYSYRFLSQFARENESEAVINTYDLNILGRKLYAAFERKAGKIEMVNPNITSTLHEEQLSFMFKGDPDNPSWAMHSGSIKPGQIPIQLQPLKRSRSLIELLSWSYLNTLLDDKTHYSLFPGESHLNDFELQSLISSFHHLIPLPLPAVPQEKLQLAARPVQTTLYINVGIDPLASSSEKGVHRITHQTDSLVYSGLKENLVLTLDTITQNSWNEIIVSRFDGQEALIDCLRAYIQATPPFGEFTPPRLEIKCFCRSRAGAIANRVEELFRDLIACYYSGTRKTNSRYILEIERAFYSFQFQETDLNITRFENESQLMAYFAQPQTEFSAIVFDRYARQRTVLREIIELTQPDTIQLFYQIDEELQQAQVYLHDEQGSLLTFTTNCQQEQMLIVPLQRFIAATLYRRNTDAPGLDAAQNLPRVLFYEIATTQGSQLRQITPKKFPVNPMKSSYYNVQAIADIDANNNIQFTIYCDHNEFSELEHGDEIYRVVAEHILAQREQGETYPCYITDLDLSRYSAKKDQAAQLQTTHYFEHKLQIERALNRAMQLVNSAPNKAED